MIIRKKIKINNAISEIRCSSCFVTLKRLKKDGLSDFLLKIINDKGEEKYICKICFMGW